MLMSKICELEELDISWNCCSSKGSVKLGEALRFQVSIPLSSVKPLGGVTWPIESMSINSGITSVGLVFQSHKNE